MTPSLFTKGEGIPVLKSWWKLHTGHEFRQAMTADSGILIKDAEGNPICVCFLYFPSNSKLCHISFITRNPRVSPIRAGKAIKLLIGFSVHVCRRMGYDVIYAATANQSLQKEFSNSGFLISPDGATTAEFTKEL